MTAEAPIGGSIWWYAVQGDSNEHTSGEAVKPYADSGAWHNLSTGGASTTEFELTAGEYVCALFAVDPGVKCLAYELITVVEDDTEAPATGDASLIAIAMATVASLGAALVIGQKR